MPQTSVCFDWPRNSYPLIWVQIAQQFYDFFFLQYFKCARKIVRYIKTTYISLFYLCQRKINHYMISQDHIWAILIRDFNKSESRRRSPEVFMSVSRKHPMQRVDCFRKDSDGGKD